MTVIVSLPSNKCGVIAADGRGFAPWQARQIARIERDRAIKTFRCEASPVLFGVAGQLAPSSEDLSNLIIAALDAAQVTQLSDALTNFLMASEENLTALASVGPLKPNHAVDTDAHHRRASPPSFMQLT